MIKSLTHSGLDPLHCKYVSIEQSGNHNSDLAYGNVSKKDADTAAIKSVSVLVIPHAPSPGS